VEIEVEYGVHQERESSIPVEVNVGSSAAVPGALEASTGVALAPAKKKKTDVIPRVASGLALASGFFSTYSTVCMHRHNTIDDVLTCCMIMNLQSSY
jgi:hypothetical protein